MASKQKKACLKYPENFFKIKENFIVNSVPSTDGLTTNPCEIGPRLNIKMVFLGMRISTIKIKQSIDHLIFIMGIPILLRQHLYIETAAPGHNEQMTFLKMSAKIIYDFITHWGWIAKTSESQISVIFKVPQKQG